MKTINKTYEIYSFDELDKEVQESLLNFQFNGECQNWFRGNGKFPSSKEAQALLKHVAKRIEQGDYFKNGDFVVIK